MCYLSGNTENLWGTGVDIFIHSLLFCSLLTLIETWAQKHDNIGVPHFLLHLEERKNTTDLHTKSNVLRFTTVYTTLQNINGRRQSVKKVWYCAVKIGPDSERRLYPQTTSWEEGTWGYPWRSAMLHHLELTDVLNIFDPFAIN